MQHRSFSLCYKLKTLEVSKADFITSLLKTAKSPMFLVSTNGRCKKAMKYLLIIQSAQKKPDSLRFNQLLPSYSNHYKNPPILIMFIRGWVHGLLLIFVSSSATNQSLSGCSVKECWIKDTLAEKY